MEGAPGAQASPEEVEADLSYDEKSPEEIAKEIADKFQSVFDRLKGTINLDEMMSPAQLKRSMDRQTKYMEQALANQNALRAAVSRVSQRLASIFLPSMVSFIALPLHRHDGFIAKEYPPSW